MKAKKSLGQNFLKDPHYRQKIIEALSLSEKDRVLEIGPGLGALTNDIAEKCGELMLVEKDEALAFALEKKYSGNPKVTVITGDFLKIQIPEGNGDIKVVGNLPYNVASQIFFRLIQNRKNFSELFLMFQKEMALRFVASPSTKDYGLPTLWASIYTEAKILFHLPPNAFNPVPKVHSTFVHFKMRETPLLREEESEDFFTMMRLLFQQRRKTIQSTMKKLRGKVPPTARAEAMTVGELIDLFRVYGNAHAVEGTIDKNKGHGEKESPDTGF